MDKTTRVEEIQKDLKEFKAKRPAEFEKATEKLSGLLKKYPDIKEDKTLQYMIVYSYLRVGDKIDEEITPAFREYDGPYKILSSNLKMDPKSIMSYLFLSLDNLVLKSERSHNVYVLTKKEPRPVKVTNKTTQQKEDRKVMNLTLWVDDMKAMTTLAVWDNQIPMYDGISENKTYKMQLNYNGQNFFPPNDPMAKEFQFVPDYAEMLKFITENYSEMREPYSSLENADAGKSFYLIGKVLKEAGGGVVLSPIEPTTSKIALQRTGEARKLDEGEDILVLGSMRRSKPFQGRDGKVIQPTSDYTLYPNAVIRLSPSKSDGKSPTQQNNGSAQQNEAPKENKPDGNLNPDDLGL